MWTPSACAQWRQNEFQSLGAAHRLKFFLSCSTVFVSTSTMSRFGERFRDGQYSLVSFFFAVLLLTVPPDCPAICKKRKRGTFTLCHIESAPLHLLNTIVSHVFKAIADKTRNFSDASYSVRSAKLWSMNWVVNEDCTCTFCNDFVRAFFKNRLFLKYEKRNNMYVGYYRTCCAYLSAGLTHCSREHQLLYLKLRYW